MEQIIINPNNIDDIIAREIEGSATFAEINALNIWKNTSKENEQYYNQMHAVNNFYNHDVVVNTEAAWSKVKSAIKNDTATEQISQPNISLFSWKYFGYAASIAVLLFAGFNIFNHQNNAEVYVSNSNGINQKLNDGSLIQLDKNSALSLIENKKREYTFSGIGKFTVKHNEADPFILHINKLLIKDIGTVFDVIAQPENDTVQVKVSEGSVQFFMKDNIGLTLIEGEEAIYIKSKNKFFKRFTDANKALLNANFQNAVLGDVIDQLSYSFRKQIAVDNPAIKLCNITVDFSNAEYLLVKDIIQETLNLKIEENGSDLIIKGRGCQ